MEIANLMEIDKDLAEILLFKSNKLKDFNKKSHHEQSEFLITVLKRIEPIINEDKWAWNINLKKESPQCLGGAKNLFLNYLHVINKPNHVRQIGWHYKHGRTFQYFEKENEIIYVSYYSEGHPQKEFRHKYSFLDEDHSIYMDKLTFLHITESKITDVQTEIKKISIKAK